MLGNGKRHMEGNVIHWSKEFRVEAKVFCSDTKLADLWHGIETCFTQTVKVVSDEFMNHLYGEFLAVPAENLPVVADIPRGKVSGTIKIKEEW